AWEAQFGDFVNGAQVVIDQFLAASDVKWEQRSRLALLLPHGYEGQGPEHSSGRVERFLELCAEDNMCVANVTTAGQLFHILRRQVLQSPVMPLILFTPKRYLRAREAYSGIAELTEGEFHEVLDDPAAEVASVRRVLMASGKVALDLMGARHESLGGHVAVVRAEQLHPWPHVQLASVLERYSEASEIVWVQEEPANMGAWGYVREGLAELAAGRELELVARAPSGSPATGSHALHELEQEDIIFRALSK
ncbi:MAG TPA: multifunctional oxoglutarate decarboxylase/oxoglutarate dehydrogenase thiamine pyrophosphate-binding subunit/dihydrolipoyllysine-residue succinyltransferase subunit, partial [Acidimicrobiales bacterium]|nr:multifunctional oxoglutarate decarboxylase/oxoglutarate dehydrogenase thiamine pyrophosphate-binding subunit/dihydrolipoyllysine-residue succinyltransferase subunit [Acidimicrobiales bacterium]